MNLKEMMKEKKESEQREKKKGKREIQIIKFINIGRLIFLFD